MRKSKLLVDSESEWCVRVEWHVYRRLWFQWASTISIHYYLDIGLLINKISLWTAWRYGKFIWSTQYRLNEERCEFLHKIGIRNNEINARNLSFFLIIVLILLLLNLCLDMTDGFPAFWSILTNLLRKHHWSCEFENQAGRCVQHYVIKCVSDLPPDHLLQSFGKHLFVVSLTSARRLTQGGEQSCGRLW